jgi:hypothetical protein
MGSLGSWGLWREHQKDYLKRFLIKQSGNINISQIDVKIWR